MTQLAYGHDPDNGISPWPSTAYQKIVKDGETIYRNAVVSMDSNGEWVEATATAADVVYGFARLGNAESMTGDGTKELVVDTGAKVLAGSGLSESDEGSVVYCVDDQTFSLSSDTGARPPMGLLMKVLSTTSGVVAIDPHFNKLAAAADLANAGMTVSKKTVTVGHADLSAAATTQALSIGTALPSNSRIIGVDMRALTVFSGGSVSALVVDIGVTGDTDALIDGADLVTAAIDGGPSSMPAGIRPNKTYASGGQLLASFTATGDNLVNLTAGSVIIDVLYVVLA